MREKIARAMYERIMVRVSHGARSQVDDVWVNQKPEYQADWLAAADAALDALLEPTEGMRSAAKFDYGHDAPCGAWESMVRAAREGK